MCVETHCCNCPVVSTAYWVDRGVDCPVHHPPPHPSPGPPFIFPLPPPPGCLELSGKQPIKSNETRLRRDRWYRGKTVQVLPCSRKTFCLAETRMILNSGRSQLDKGRFVIRRKLFIPSHYCNSRFKEAGFSEVFEGSPLRRFVMLLPCALHSLLCALSCAWWLHGGAASRLKSPSLPIQPEREPLPFKGTSGMLFLET